MRIDSIELIKFKRFVLNNITNFKLDASELVQVILGTNGSGKSSLLGELTPLPPVSSNYHKGGGKIICITHKSCKYKLSSLFGAGKEHSFLKDEEELNTGGTITIQRQLVEQEFGITQDIHDLMTGLEKFSSMSPARRREWFTRLPEVSYDYALKTYNKSREKLRDVGGALKIAKKRLVQETAKAVSVEEIKHMESKISVLVDEVTKLHRLRGPDRRRIDAIQAELSLLDKETSEQYTCFQELCKSVSWIGFIAPDEIREQIAEKKGKLSSLMERTNSLVATHDKLNGELAIAKQNGSQDLQSLKDNETRLKKVMADSMAAITFLDINQQDGKEMRSALDAVMEQAMHVFTTLPSDPERKCVPDKKSNLEEKRTTVRNRILDLQGKIHRVSHECGHLDELSKSGKINCPECHHGFSPGYDSKKHDHFKKSLETGQALLVKAKEEDSQLTEQIEVITNYLNLYQPLYREATRLKSLGGLWNEVFNCLVIYESPITCVTLLTQYSKQIDLRITYQDAEWELVKAEHLIAVMERQKNFDIDNAAKRVSELEEEIGRCSSEQVRLSRQINQEQEMLKAGLRLLELEQAFRSYRVCHGRLYDEGLETLLNGEIDSNINARQIQIAQLQYQLNAHKEHASTIARIELDIAGMEKQETAMKLVVNALSPTEGLIAEGLYGFMKNFVKKINVVIKSIWTYDLEVQTCALNEDGDADLDYKFPVLVRNDSGGGHGEDDKPIPDVGIISSGMKEVVDLAFKIVAMHYLKLGKAPLILDEFGITFDKQHRINATHTIKNLLEQLSFSQLWLVSHYEESYMCFTTAEICVLSATNIVTPDKNNYNKHVIMAS